MYDYGMSIAARFGSTQAESEDIANEGFYKVIAHISRFDPKVPFLLWVRRIIINCGIDQYRKGKSQYVENQTDNIAIANKGGESLDSEYLLDMVRSLPPQYRMVFVLHAVEGFSHEEIAQKLNIKKGTSKSNLSKARTKLQAMVHTHNKIYGHAGS